VIDGGLKSEAARNAYLPATRSTDKHWLESTKDQSQGRSLSMFRTLEEHAERFHGKRPGLFARIVRFKALVISSMLVIGVLLTAVMSLD